MDRKARHTPGHRSPPTHRDRRGRARPADARQLSAGEGADAWSRLLERVRERVTAGDGVRLALPGGGRVSLDRPLPFVCLHRLAHPPRQADRLVTGQASYLLAAEADLEHPGLEALLAELSAALTERFGWFALVELWEHRHEQRPRGEPLAPAFTLAAEGLEAAELDEVRAALEGVRVDGRSPRVRLSRDSGLWPEPRLGGPALGARLGVAVEPIYRGESPADGAQLYPLVLLELERELTGALQDGLSALVRRRTSLGLARPHALARSRLDRATREVDRHLAAAGRDFDFLFHVTPCNGPAAWHAFEATGYQEVPELHYRPLPIDPEVTKRTLFGIPIEQVEDPTAARLFRHKHEELDRQISMLLTRGTRAFLYSGLQVYGEVDADLLRLARRLLYRLPARAADEAPGAGPASRVSGETMANYARAEIDAYRARYPEFEAEVILSDEISSGLLVSKNRVYVNDDWSAPLFRVEPLLHHEVGTHVLTYVNGRAQPLELFHAGLADYETLQEGLAVLAEYLAGGLSQSRMRVLAARVLAVDALVGGADFIETFRLLADELGLSPRQAFFTTLRVHRGGGLVKDAIYLRGLGRLLDYLAGGGPLEPLYLGKISLDRIAEVVELCERGILVPPKVMPRFLDDPAARARLDELRRGRTLLDLVGG